MASAFATAQAYAGSFRADLLKIQIAGVDVNGMLIQNIQFNFTQQVNLLYELASKNMYFIGGRAQGNAGISRMVGPAGGHVIVIQSFNNICTPADLTLSAKTSSCGTPDTAAGAVAPTRQQAGGVYTLKKAVLTSIGGNVSANDVMFTETLQLQFVDLDMPDLAAAA